jgi:hypothetical protein
VRNFIIGGLLALLCAAVWLGAGVGHSVIGVFFASIGPDEQGIRLVNCLEGMEIFGFVAMCLAVLTFWFLLPVIRCAFARRRRRLSAAD